MEQFVFFVVNEYSDGAERASEFMPANQARCLVATWVASGKPQVYDEKQIINMRYCWQITTIILDWVKNKLQGGDKLCFFLYNILIIKLSNL